MPVRHSKYSLLLLHRYFVTTRNDSCIKVGSDESHFNVLLIARDIVTRQCPQTTTFQEKGEPKKKKMMMIAFV